MDNTPILGIEVDGVLHHRFDEVQVARDRRKNGILVKIGLPLLRLSTDGSSEKERIVGALEQAMQQGCVPSSDKSARRSEPDRIRFAISDEQKIHGPKPQGRRRNIQDITIPRQTGVITLFRRPIRQLFSLHMSHCFMIVLNASSCPSGG